MNTLPEITAVQFGRIEGERDTEYHAQDAVSASRLRLFKRRPGGPALYYQRYIAKTLAVEETDAMREGRLLHTLVLEPHKFESEYAVAPEGIDRRTNAGKAAWAQFLAESEGKTVVKHDAVSLLRGMAAMVQAHPAAAQLLSAGKPEITWRVKAGGWRHLPPLQCRTDWFNPDGCELSEGRPYVVDLKSTATLDEDAFGNFARSVEDHVYHCQAALYMAILGALGVACYDFFFIAVEKCAPFGVEVYKLNERALKEGQDRTEDLLTELDRCYGRHEWPNTSPEVKELKLSPRYWARKDEAFA
jgi:hypothetical protein